MLNEKEALIPADNSGHRVRKKTENYAEESDDYAEKTPDYAEISKI